MGKSVPYLILHRLGTENYVTVEDLADRWDTAQVARQGPRGFGFGIHSGHLWLCCNEIVSGCESCKRDDPNTSICVGHSGARAR